MSKEDPFNSDILEDESLLMGSEAIRSLLSNEPIDLQEMVLRSKKRLIHLRNLMKSERDKRKFQTLIDEFEDIKKSLKRHGIKTL